MAIFGIRGIGKTSLAQQIKLIAEGDKTLPKDLNLSHFLPKKDFNFLVHFIKCDEYVRDIPTLVKRIMLGEGDCPSIFEHSKTGDRKLESAKQIFAKSESLELYDKKYKRINNDDIIHLFRQGLTVIKKDNLDKTGILILIDEFDIIRDKQGFASLIKSCSNNYVKFGVIGIAENIAELIEDHASIGRQVDEIQIQPMSELEMVRIISTAEEKINHEIVFDNEIKNKIGEECHGFPYFVHLLGKEALTLAFERATNLVNNDIYKEVKNKIVQGKLSFTYEDIYTNTVRTSKEREVLLKAFAKTIENQILKEEIYKDVRVSITNPSQYINELVTPKIGSPILIEDKLKRKVRFIDPVFKVYVNMREYYHKD
jgi:hypothetical protein